VALLGNLTGSSQFFNNAAFYNDVATQSLRFDQSSSARLEKTPNASNRITWTWSAWVKRSKLGDERAIWSVGSSSKFALFFHHLTHQLRVWSHNGEGSIYTNRVFRDLSAWYHICLTSKNSGNYYELYVNGVKETSFSLDQRSSYPGGNEHEVNSNDVHYIGAWNNGGLQYFDGYLADVNFIDGTCVGDTNGILDEFIEIKNGVCIPKKYTGSYGTNGYRLEFKQTGVGTASTTTIGADTSGNTNHYASSGIVASDCDMLDSPENNFCTLNTLQISDNDSNFFPSEGNLKLSANNNSGYRNCSSTFSPMGFKGYFEFTGLSTMNFYLGPIEDTTHPTNQDYADGNHNFLYFISDGQVQKSQGGTAAQVVRSASDHALGTISTGDVLGMAFDFTGTNRNVWLHRANTYGTASGGAGNPATGANPVGTSSILDSTQPYRFNFGINNGARLHFNFGQDSSFGGNETAQGNTDENGNGDFYYTPPSGFLALCSANLPEPTIGPNAATQADDHFNTVLWTGNGADDRSISGVGFQPDFVWLKQRNGTNYHTIVDSSRGATKRLFTNATEAESTDADSLQAFESDGFQVGTTGGMNGNTNTFVAWNWKANGGTTSSNTDGSITSTVQANTDAGFSIVLYTGTGSNATVGHGIGIAPRMIIIKKRNAIQNWVVYHEEIGNDRELLLNVSNAQTNSNSVYFNNTSPTTSVFSLGTDSYANENNANFVAYCFAEVEGYSKIGKYNPNNTTDNAFVHTGFKPAMVILKGAEINNQEWGILDNKRPGYNSVYFLQPQSNTTETTSNIVDFLSNGFKIRETGGVGYLTSNYIYMAFAEAPFKYANAG